MTTINAINGTPPVQVGLTGEQVEKSRREHGWNETDDDNCEPEPLHAKILEQLTNPLIGLLLASALISVLLRQYENAVGIVTAVVLVGVVGAWQERETEASVAALRQLAPNKAHVHRQPGGLQEVAAREVVVGDQVEIRQGDRCAADIKMLQWNGLMVDESILTGETDARPVCDSMDLVFMGTTVSHGWGRGVVVAVGRQTRFGQMVGLMQESRCTTRTPLQTELDRLAHQLTIGSGCLIAVISVLSLLFPSTTTTPFKQRLIDTLTTAVSLAVAAIPEGLPLVSTVTMALAVRRLAHRHVIVKRLPAVEAMGSVSAVCFDKTGTLTVNRLCVGKFAFEDPRGAVGTVNQDQDHDQDDDAETAFLRLAATCTDVSETDNGELIGNQLDCCLIRYCRQRQINQTLPKRDTVLFSSERRCMQVTLCDGRKVVKGAVEQFDSVPDEYRRLSAEWSSAGLRVIAVGVDDGDSDSNDGTSTSSFCGIIAFQDGLREGATAVVRQLSSYGVTPIMLTGDSKETAMAVATALHWPNPQQTVHGRQSPADKLRVINHLPANCAMVGDGVNDGAAVRRAMVGVAMGGPQSTDVARQAADIVLSTDRLMGIIDVIREGRSILVNIRRFLGFQLSSSMVSLLLVVLPATKKSLTPLHLLLLNIVMDGPPAQSLAMSSVNEDDLVSREERVVLFDSRLLWRCVLRAVLVSGGCVIFTSGHPDRSILPPLLLLSMANAFTWTDSVNPYLVYCLLASIVFLVVASMLPFVGGIVGVGRLQTGEWMVLVGLFAAYVLAFNWSLRTPLLARRYQKLHN